MSEQIEFHPFCKLFDELPEDQLSNLANDIKLHGQHQPILLYEGQIIDGRNRYIACLKAGIEPKFETVQAQDPSALVASLNLFRRHLTDSQRARLAAELVNSSHGGVRSNCPSDNIVTFSQAADAANVSVPSVRRARVVKELGNQELNRALMNDHISVAKAERIARLPQSEQSAALNQTPPKTVRQLEEQIEKLEAKLASGMRGFLRDKIELEITELRAKLYAQCEQARNQSPEPIKLADSVKAFDEDGNPPTPAPPPEPQAVVHSEIIAYRIRLCRSITRIWAPEESVQVAKLIKLIQETI